MDGRDRTDRHENEFDKNLAILAIIRENRLSKI